MAEIEEHLKPYIDLLLKEPEQLSEEETAILAAMKRKIQKSSLNILRLHYGYGLDPLEIAVLQKRHRCHVRTSLRHALESLKKFHELMTSDGFLEICRKCRYRESILANEYFCAYMNIVGHSRNRDGKCKTTYFSCDLFEPRTAKTDGENEVLHRMHWGSSPAAD